MVRKRNPSPSPPPALTAFAATLTANRSPLEELTPEIRAAICASVAAGQPKSAVARAFGVTRGTVNITVKRRAEFGTFSSLKRRGRPRKVNEELERQIAELKGQGLKFEEVRERLGVGISASTFKRIVKSVREREREEGRGKKVGKAKAGSRGKKKDGGKGLVEGEVQRRDMDQGRGQGQGQGQGQAVDGMGQVISQMGEVMGQAMGQNVQAMGQAQMMGHMVQGGHPQQVPGGQVEVPMATMPVVTSGHVTSTFMVESAHEQAQALAQLQHVTHQETM